MPPRRMSTVQARSSVIVPMRNIDHNWHITAYSTGITNSFLLGLQDGPWAGIDFLSESISDGVFHSLRAFVINREHSFGHVR